MIIINVERLRRWSLGSKHYRGWLWSSTRVGESTNYFHYDVCLYYRLTNFKYSTFISENKKKGYGRTLKEKVENGIDGLMLYGKV